jgi:hypothetical protein
MKARTKLVGLAAIAIALTGSIYVANSQDMGSHFGPMRGMGMGMIGPGPMRGMGMPGIGLRGDDRTMAQLENIQTLLADHERITRTVTNLPNGIRTVTESDDPATAELIKKHVGDMAKRVADGDDPGLPIESENLHAIFRSSAKLHTTYETTDKGVTMVQTSDDPPTVAALQAHAQEVVDLVKGGMPALHEAMMKRGAGPMQGPMMGGGIMGGGMMPGPMMMRMMHRDPT